MTDMTEASRPLAEALLTGRELIDERRTADEFLVEAEGELSPELEALLNDVNAKIEDKIEATARYCLSEEARAKAIKEEGDRLAARRKAILNGVEHNRNVRIRALLGTLGRDSLKGKYVSVGIQSNPPSLVVDATQWDEVALRGLAMSKPEFVTHTPEVYAVNKDQIKRAIKAGAPVPDGMQVVQSTSVRIR